jgi:hypothetical protein
VLFYNPAMLIRPFACRGYFDKPIHQAITAWVQTPRPKRFIARMVLPAHSGAHMLAPRLWITRLTKTVMTLSRVIKCRTILTFCRGHRLSTSPTRFV